MADASLPPRAIPAVVSAVHPADDTTPADFAAESLYGATIRFFLSSTFADFQTERDVLQRRVFPELRQICSASGFRLQPIDLRWGVSEAAGIERQTLRICFDELERCRQLSPDLFLLIQLGQRYGSYILPPQVPAVLMERLLPLLSPDERAHFAAIYELDENAVPPEYVLLRAEGPEQAKDQILRERLVWVGRAAGIQEDDLLLFSGSATHREIQLGLLGEPPLSSHGSGGASGVLCAVRTFVGEPRGPAVERFVETDAAQSDQVRRLTEAVLERVPSDQTLRYAIEWPDDSGPVLDEGTVAEAYLSLLRPKLEAVISARVAARESAAARGRNAMALANAAFERERAARVEGREVELARIASYLAGESGAELPLVVTGASGSGKSTLLAEAALRAAGAQPGAVRIVRYCGVTPGAESLSALLPDLRHTIAQAYGQPDPAPLTDESQLISAVAAHLATLRATSERPLYLIIDALDQLGVYAKRTDWLPPSLAPHVRVVVSVLADRPELDALRNRLPAEQVISLAPLDRASGRAMLRDLLAIAPPRTLTPAQEDAVLSAFAGQGLPLHLRLLATEARRWRSFDALPVDAPPLAASIPEWLQDMLRRLEAPERSGRTLIARALGDVAAARFGLTEDELLDLLARDAAVRDAQRALSPNSPVIDANLPLPVALWARLHAEVAPLLTERRADEGVRLLTFYHGQLRVAVEARYLTGTERLQRHRALADYFSGQPWRFGAGQWNWRKVRELASQLEGAGDRASAEQALSGLADEMTLATASTDANAANDSVDASSSQAHAVVGVIRVMTALRDHLETAGYWQVGLRLYMQELAAVRASGNRAVEGETLGNMGLLADHLGLPEEADRDYQQALEILREVGNRAAEGSTLNNLGTLAMRRGQMQQAARYLEQALVIRREVGDRGEEGSTLNNLGQLFDLLGQRDEAANAYLQALAIEREVGDRAGEAVTLNNLGQLAYHLGRADEAATYLQQALVILHEVGDRPGEAQALSNLGSLAGRLGQWQEAKDYFEQALAIHREVSDRSSEGTTLTNLGVLAAHTGHPEEAESTFQRALAILREIEDRAGEVNALNSLGALARDHDRFEDAARYYAEALPIAHAIGARAIEGTLLNNLGSLVRAQGRPEEARGYLEQALAIERQVGDRTGEGHTLNNLGALVREQGRFKEARSYFEQALAIRREVGDREGEAGTLINLGALARVQRRPEVAARNYAEALAICEAIGAVDLANIVRGNIAYLAEQQPQRSRWWPFGRRDRHG